MDELGRAAIEYARRGWSVIGLKPREKVPSFAEWRKELSNDEQSIRLWWEEYPTDNVAIACGECSGWLGVIDIDVDDEKGIDGFEYLTAWQRKHGELPETATVTTARGGMHLYYRFSKETMPRNSANGEVHIDFRGEGGYVMAPPSIHPNGRKVEWDLDPDDVEVAEATPLVLKFVNDIRPTTAISQHGDFEKFELPERITRGERDNVLFRYACQLQSNGMTDGEIKVLVHSANDERCDVPFPAAIVDQKIRQALKYPKGEPLEVMTLESDTSVCLAYEKSKPANTIDNCIEILEHDGALKGRFFYDSMSYTRMVATPLPWDDAETTRPVMDSDYIEFTAYCESKWNVKGKDNATSAVIAVCNRHRRNTVTEWLDSLEWDGQERISMLLTDYLGCAPTDYNVAVMHLLMQGAVRRAYEPGAKFDYMPVLVGAQGQGKSFFVSIMAFRPEWYLDNMNTFEGDGAVEKLRGVWFAEVAELTAFKRQKDVEAIKAFVTVRNDTIRPKYGRETELRPRRCVFVGTTNDRGFLTDKTGNRRYLPIQCMETEPLRNMFSNEARAWVEQCWAEAVNIYKTIRPPLVLSERITEKAEAVQAEFLEDDPRVGLIQEYLDGILMDACRTDKRVCVAELCENALTMERREYFGKRSVSNEIHRIMRHEIGGWVPSNGKQKVPNYGSQLTYEPENYGEFLDVFVR